ncbi:hypothetical protein BGX38DRAFT_1274737 [Terfezia claveryi]|nr:hypothetical protein BGX38DRAFT_1274737 [Terfezia claveryi]
MSLAVNTAETSDANDILIASWSLGDPASSNRAESIIHLQYQNEGDNHEAIFVDDRKVVEPLDIRPGGKYRNIIKLFMRYEGNTTAEAMGTGWLIAPDVLVTAGHCVFDWSFPLNKAVSIGAYMGYNGKASIGSPNVITRYATQVATTVRWLTAKETKPGDFAVLKLNKPFDLRVPPVNFKPTPMKGAGVLGVVGYPGDKSFGGEQGAQMYEMFLPTHYDRNHSENHMLDYLVSTFAGQSGSPVLLEEHGKYTSIGVHTYGGRTINSATVLGNDNHITTYRAFCVQEMWKQDHYKATRVPAGVPAGVSVYRIPMQEIEIGQQSTESFLDVFKDVLKVVLPVASTVVSVGAPLLGPVGAVVAPLAGVALQAASKLTESAFENATESHIRSALDSDGAVHRAILCEAAIHALGRLDDETLHNSGALATMSQVYAAHADRVKRLTPHLSKALLEPSLRIAMDQVRLAHNPTLTPSSQFKKRAPIPGAESFLAGTESELAADSNGTTFVRDMITGDSEVVNESFIGTMFDVLKKGAIFATPLVTALARTGLDKLDQAVAAKNPRTESGFVENPQSVLDMLPKRALVGEAALHAVMKLPKEYLLARYAKPGSDVETESLKDVMNSVSQKIAPRVFAAAPVVYKAVTPIIKDLMKQNVGSGGKISIKTRAVVDSCTVLQGGSPLGNGTPSSTGKQLASKQKSLTPLNGSVKHVVGKGMVMVSEKFGNGNYAAAGDEDDEED